MVACKLPFFASLGFEAFYCSYVGAVLATMCSVDSSAVHRNSAAHFLKSNGETLEDMVRRACVSLVV